MHARAYKAETAVRCDLNAPGHNALIPKGQTYYVINEGKAQGKYHSFRCYEAALRHYEALEKDMQHG